MKITNVYKRSYSPIAMAHTCSHTCSHGHHTHTHASTRSKVAKTLPKKLYYYLGAAVGVALLSLVAPAFMIAVAILAVNTVLELHKNFTRGMPLDIEVLTVGVAYLAATQSPILAAIVAIVGPGLSEATRGHMCTGTWFRPFALLSIIPVAMLLGSSFWGLTASVIFGAVANYIRVLLTAPNSDPFMSLLSRTTQILFGVHLLTFII